MTEPTATRQAPPDGNGTEAHNGRSGQASELTRRTVGVIGRSDELALLHECLYQRQERHFLYFYGEGGLGKTRLLEALLQMVREAGPGYCSSGIIDLYHTDMHATSDLEEAIIGGLDPGRHYFERYREQRAVYQLLRERGADPSVLEERRESLSRLFVEESGKMALDARKLVICFDTFEMLQHESSIVEEMAELKSVDARIRPWLLQKLPQLKNVLVVFAGRPPRRPEGEKGDPQRRLLEDLGGAFGADFQAIELKSLTLPEVREFIAALPDGGTVVPEAYLPIVHRLTRGRPIFLHLLVDLLRLLAPEPAEVLRRFDDFMPLVEVEEGDLKLEAARGEMQRYILDGIFNYSDLGGYLQRIALMPKGVNVQILTQAQGMPPDEADALVARLEPLSFVKSFKESTDEATPAGELHATRLFLHDEMYSLLATSRILHAPEITERAVAHALVVNYYDKQIDARREAIKRLGPQERIPARRELQKLEVERLYYRLVQDPRAGYAEYRKLSDQANRWRAVGFGMRLLDEFLRFYGTPGRRGQFEARGITADHVLRESAQMWVERFHWWALYPAEITFVDRILADPGRLRIRPDIDHAVMGNIFALYVRARAMTNRFEPDLTEQAKKLLDCLPPLEACNPDEALARARLATSIGYEYRQGGLLERAVEQYRHANAAFRLLGDHPDELAILLNNLAFIYARQGHFDLAAPLADEALEINEEHGNDYSAGLSLYHMARIETRRGLHERAIAHCNEALERFRGLEDVHGTAVAYLALGEALRKRAKENLDRSSRRAGDASVWLEDAEKALKSGLEETRKAGLEANVPELLAELGKVYRERGRLVTDQADIEKSRGHYHRSDEYFRDAVGLPNQGPCDQADIYEDWAEALVYQGIADGAAEKLAIVETLIPPQYFITPGHAGLGPATEYYWPLGKVARLRAQMALRRAEYDAALRQSLLAYTYFTRFSAESAERRTTIRIMYDNMRRLPPRQQHGLLQGLREWAAGYDKELESDSFFETLGGLLGA